MKRIRDYWAVSLIQSKINSLLLIVRRKLFRLKSLPPPHLDLDTKSPTRLKDRKKIRPIVPLVLEEILNQIHTLTVS